MNKDGGEIVINDIEHPPQPHCGADEELGVVVVGAIEDTQVSEPDIDDKGAAREYQMEE